MKLRVKIRSWISTVVSLTLLMSLGCSSQISSRSNPDSDALNIKEPGEEVPGLPEPEFEGDVIDVNLEEIELAEQVLLFSENRWNWPIVIRSDASAEILIYAETLADYLEKMTGVEIAIVESNDANGIRLGTYDDWNPAWKQSESHLLLSTSESVFVLGSKQEDLEKGIWHLLEILGYRQYMPTPIWEFVPNYDTIRVLIGVREENKFKHMEFAYNGCGILVDLQDDIDDWKMKNRFSPHNTLSLGHSWGQIIDNNETELESHPDWYSEEGNKLCVFQPEIQKMVIDHVKGIFDKNSNLLVASVSASDGSTGWDDPCATGEEITYSPSDRQVFLANTVQSALRNDPDPFYHDKRVAFMAYGETSPPPSLYTVDADVVVAVAKGYIFDGLSYEDVYNGYQAAGAKNMGPYEYLSVFTWDFNKAGWSRASSPSYWKETVGETLKFGTGNFSFFTSESSDATAIGDGLGYWIMGKLLLKNDRKNLATDIDSLKDDFFDKLFGDHATDVRALYELMDGDSNDGIRVQLLITTDLLNDIFNRLKTIRDAAKMGPADIVSRIDELVLYARYLELRYRFDTAETSNKVNAYDEMMAHVYRIKDMHIVHYRCFFYDAQTSDELEELELQYGMTNISWSTATDGNPWPGGAFSATEIEAIIADGIANNPALSFDPVSFSKNLVKPTAFDQMTDVGYINYALGDQTWYFFADVGVTELVFEAKSGMAYNFKGNTIVNVYDNSGAVIDSVEIPNDKTNREYRVALPRVGLYELEFIDAAGFKIDWHTTGYNFPITFELSQIEAPKFQSDYSLYFYVPVGTKTVGGFARSLDVEIIDPNDQILYVSTSSQSYFDVPVPTGADGKIWKINNCNKDCFLLTVPPQAAYKPSELLLPKEVVDRDNLVP